MAMFPVLILAGGLATRLRPLTETIPKALIEVAGRPFIEHQLLYLRAQGVTKVVLAVGYLAELIRDCVGDGSQFGLQIEYIEDGPTLLGTGGAVKRALSLLGDPFFVQYGDSYLPINYLEVQTAFLTSQKPALMTVLKNNNQWDKSNVIYSDGVLIEYNKHEIKSAMTYIDYGLGILKKEVFAGYSSNEMFDLAAVYNELSGQKQLAGFEVFERFYEIGSLAGIEQTDAYLSKLIVKE
jgi:N-acetyl-alpha-D-muramate 1-phosphate uridylyltransferase